jgi:glycosyltransferase involved in cell wall biosynthesis
MQSTAESPVTGAAWITWEHQRRNVGVSSGLGVPLFVLAFTGGRLKRYVKSLLATARVLTTKRPSVLFVQNPSIVLAFTAVVWGRLGGRPVIVDAHNAGLTPLEGRSSLLTRAAAFISRHASLTIVSNAALTPIVDAYGGRPFVLPDPIPELPAGVAPDGAADRLRVLFICTYASDEPYPAVVQAARAFIDEAQVYVTGRLKPQHEALRQSAPANVIFTGFLPEGRFIGLLHAADVVMDLTTRDNCLVCGAYEGVAAGKPLILSDSRATREYFSRGVVYTDNTPGSIEQCLREALADRRRLAQEVAQLRTRLVDDWSRRSEILKREIAKLRGQDAQVLR